MATDSARGEAAEGAAQGGRAGAGPVSDPPVPKLSGAFGLRLRHGQRLLKENRIEEAAEQLGELIQSACVLEPAGLRARWPVHGVGWGVAWACWGSPCA